MSQGLDGVRKEAKERKQERFTALLHHLNVDLLRDSFYALQRKASPGVDGVTWQEYETGLEDRLVDLHSRVHRGTYRAKPSRRVFIPKADGRKRPLGVAALEDKIVQQAAVTILNQIYEVDFKGFSYGFRPGRSPHQALDALTVGIQRKRVNWVLDADIRGFFDNLSHEWTMKFIKHRVADFVRAGVAVTATYGASGETCSLMIEPRETLGRSVKPESPIIEEKLLEEISKELVPEEDRGKYKMGTFLDITCLPDNDCAGVQEDWTKLVIYRNSGEKGTRYETIKWKRAECRPAPGVHIP